MRTANPYQAPLTDAAWNTGEPSQRESWMNRNCLWWLFGFGGRLPRAGYWLGNLVILVVFISLVFGLAKFVKDPTQLKLFVQLAYLPMAWSSIALQVKRWHDRGKSGFWFFISFIPLIGPLWSFIELGFCRGTYGSNYYGNEA